jgi:putative acetyltransferase
VGKLLCQAIATKAKQLKLNRLFVEVIITAKPFFEHLGFIAIAQQQVSCRGQVFINLRMEKSI